MIDSPPEGRVAFDGPDFPARIRARDPAAVRAVVHAYLPQILRAARAAGARDAEEVVQEAFITFMQVAPRFEGRSHIRTWLFGILYRKILEGHRRSGRDRQMDDIDEVLESRFDEAGSWSRPPRPADAALSAKEIRAQIVDCLDASPSRQRLAFVLREVEGLSSDEICTFLQVTSTNLGVMLYRIRNRLRECLESKGVRK